MTIPEQIKALREQGWTYVALAEQLGVRWLAVRRWEYGERVPTRPDSLGRELAALRDVEPPKGRRYGPDAPQRQARRAAPANPPA